jgi:hypothetical protein
MGAMQNPDFRRAPNADLDQYGEKTSEHGHYELASQYKSGKSHFRWVEDNRTFQAPPVDNPIEFAPEPLPEQVKETDTEVSLSSQAQRAQDLVDKYTAGITSGQSPYNTQIFSATPNLNSQTNNSTETYKSNTYIDPKYSLSTPGKDAANSFLDAKKVQFGRGLNLQ